MKALILGDKKRLAYVFPETTVESLEQELGGAVAMWDTSEKDAFSQALEDVEYIFLSWGAPRLDKAFLDQAKRLKAIFYGAGTVKHLVTDDFWASGIALSSAWGLNAIPVADYVLAEVTLGLKRARFYNRQLRQKKAYPPLDELFQIPSLSGSTVGLISFGKIGQLVRERLRSLNVKVLVNDPFLSVENAAALDVERVPLDTIFSRSDVVSLHTPWLKETENMIRASHFEKMKPMSTFINTARGAIVNEIDLADVLDRRQDLDAVIDVAWPEPPANDSPLYTLPNIHLTPHIAGSLGRECATMGNEMVEELRRFRKGQPLHHQVTQSMMPTIA